MGIIQTENAYAIHQEIKPVVRSREGEHVLSLKQLVADRERPGPTLELKRTRHVRHGIH
jgi:hypothetical protein